MPDPILHLYAQDFPRDMPTVVGTRQALDALRSAISEALRRGEALSREVQDSAGETYVVKVCCRRPHASEPPPGQQRERIGKAIESESLPTSFWDRLGTR
jgi:hypothetical protein